MNHIEQYSEQHGEDAGLIYAFTVSQIEVIKGIALLNSGTLNDEETQMVADKLSNISSQQTAWVASFLDVTDEEIDHAMESASAYMEKVLGKGTVQ